MRYLILVSIIWAFSFGLIKTYLTGLDPFFVGAARLGVALLVFLPFVRLQTLNRSLIFRFLIIGGIQYGLMYGAYIYTYQFLEAHKIALFTVTTPLLVAALDDCYERRFQSHYLIFAILSVVGAIVIYYQVPDLEGALTGIALLQLSNLCFAFGQVYHRRLMQQNPNLVMNEHFGILYLGGFLVALVLVVVGTDMDRIAVSGTQVIVIIFLGILASGLGFFLWNFGATRTNAGSLAVLNNLKIPLAVFVSLLFFEEVLGSALTRLIVGGGIIVGAVLLNEYYSRRRAL
ncbi:MAG: EamA family transporter [Verrucomicrobia bacterium]|nr:EamA family transporter [Verrucomicrobiota bacterium]